MPARERLGPGLLLALLAAALVVALLVYRARTPNLALEVPRIERELLLGAAGPEGRARIRFFIRFDEPEATVEIVGARRRLARTLGDGVALSADREVVCSWDGRRDNGKLARPGPYRLRVTLPSEDREMLFPRRIDARRDGERPGVDEEAVGEVGEPPCEFDDNGELERG